jgi:chromosome partition protein MukE
MSTGVVEDLTSGDAGEESPAPGQATSPARFGFRQLEDVISDESFPDVDLALRRGRHVHQGDERWYDFLLEAQPFLEAFYRRYGCELEQRSDGYFFLLPVTDSLGKRHLGVPEMIVGQGLALCFLEPRSVQSGGVVAREELLNQLAHVMGTDALMRALNPKRKRADERLMQRTVRQKVNEALRRLSQLGFVELLDGDQLRLWPSLMRFAEPVRGLDAPSEALKRLIERGEVSIGPGDADDTEADPIEAVAADTDTDADADSASDADADPSAASAIESDADGDADPSAASAVESDADGDADLSAASASDSVAVSDEPPPPTLDFDLDWDELPPDEA